jgi:hypothetical protein
MAWRSEPGPLSALLRTLMGVRQVMLTEADELAEM